MLIIDKLWFANDNHRQEFNKLRFQVDSKMDNKKYVSAIYSLAAVEKSEIAPYIDENGIEFNKLVIKAQNWSTSDKVLIMLAMELFGENTGIPIQELFAPLDSVNVDVALKALELRYK